MGITALRIVCRLLPLVVIAVTYGLLKLVGSLKGPTARSRVKKIEKYTDEEVRQGRARNKAARQPVLERLLKFRDISSVYEQQEVLHFIYSLWNPDPLRHKESKQRLCARISICSVNS